jgi:hypothetical protein
MGSFARTAGRNADGDIGDLRVAHLDLPDMVLKRI